MRPIEFRRVWAFLALAFLCLATPLATVARPPSRAPKTWHVKVEALGRKNAKSQGDEVRIYEIRTPTEVLDWQNAQQSGPQWDLVPRSVADGGFAALATGGVHRELSATLSGEWLSITLIRHGWSGLARITVNGKSRTLDLYSAQPDLDTLTFGPAPVSSGALAARASASGWIYLAGLLACLVAAGVAWNIRRRRRLSLKAAAQGKVSFWSRASSRRAAISALLAVPTALVLLRPLFGPAPVGGLQAFLAYLYSLGSWYAMLTFWWLLRRPEDRPHGRPAVSTPGKGYWIAAALLSAGGATLIVAGAENSLNAQHAYWAKFTVRTDAPQPPELAIRYGQAPKEIANIQWQPYSQTIVSLRRQAAADVLPPVRIEQVAGDGQPINPDDLVVQGGIRDARAVSIAAPYGGMLRWPATATRVSFLVSGGPETVQFFWLDQSRTVHLGPLAQPVTFSLDGRFQGWALLPPQEIDFLRLVPAAAGPEAYAIREQILAPSVPSSELGTVRFASPSKELSVPLGAPINRRRPVILATAWLFLWLGGMFAVWVLYRCSVACAAFGITPLAGAASGGSGFARLALAVWIVCAAYHLMFALSVRTAFSPDSVKYYEMGKQLLEAPYLQNIVIVRTPGYPLFLSLVVGLFGDTVLGVAILQHLALASLSLVAMWCLWDRLPRGWVCVAGLAAGIAPAIAPSGNVLWTESLFCVFSASALLLASCYQRRSAYLFLAGVCAGGATMIRPNGLLIVPVMLAAVVVQFFWSRGAVLWRTLTASGALLIGGYLLVAAPWHMHLAVNRGNVPLGYDMREFGSWAGYIFERRMPIELPINAPNRAIFADPMAYGNDPFVALVNFPLLMGDEPVYYRETQSEWLASQSWAPHWETLKFHTTLVWDPAKSLIGIEEIRALLDGWRQPPPLVPQTSGLESVLTRLTSATPPGPSQAGTFCLALSTFALNRWSWLALLALGGGAVSCFAKPWLTPLLAYAVGSLLGYSTNLIPAERYIAVLEPLYCILAIAFLHTLWLLASHWGHSLRAHRYRSTATGAPPAAIAR